MRVRSRPAESNSKIRTPCKSPLPVAALTLTEMLRSVSADPLDGAAPRRSLSQAPPLPNDRPPRAPAFSATAWRSACGAT